MQVFPLPELNETYELGKRLDHGIASSMHEVRLLTSPIRPTDVGKQFMIRITQKSNQPEEMYAQSESIAHEYSLVRDLNQSHP